MFSHWQNISSASLYLYKNFAVFDGSTTRDKVSKYTNRIRIIFATTAKGMQIGPPVLKIAAGFIFLIIE